MEKYNDALEVNIDNAKVIFDDIVKYYCDEHGIEENDIPPAMWNDIIDEIHEKVFLNNPQMLKDTPNTLNAYNPDKVIYIYNLYRRLCNSHCQEVTLKGFTDLTGIDKQSIYNWKDKVNNNIYNANSDNNGECNNKRVSTFSFDLHEKIMSDNEQSLEAMLHDKRYNPMKVLPSLNKKHGWNLPGVSKEQAKNNGLSAATLPQLGADNLQTISTITDNSTVIE